MINRQVRSQRGVEGQGKESAMRRRSTGGDWRVGGLELLLMEAAKQGDLRGMLECLELLEEQNAKDKVNYSNKSGQTPLMVAAKGGHLECVKLLLCHSADLTAKNGQRLTAIDVAKKNGHIKIAKYLQGCIDDLIKFKTTRAHMEADVVAIAQSSNLSRRDLQEFGTLLRQLVQDCDFNVNCDNDREVPLVIRATKADHACLVQMLVEEYNATLYANDPQTGENALHLACQNKSRLRYYIVQHCRHLLMNPDNEGSYPLHIACSKNDIEFVSWLFQCISEETIDEEFDEMIKSTLPRSTSLPDLPSMKQAFFSSYNSPSTASIQPAKFSRMSSTIPRRRIQILQDVTDEEEAGLVLNLDSECVTCSPRMEELIQSGQSDLSGQSTLLNESIEFSTEGTEVGVDDVVLQGPQPKCPLELSEIIDIRILRITGKGESILHILARHGYTDLLALVLKVAKFLEHNVYLNILITRDDFTRYTPLEEAIISRNVQCFRLLVQFATSTKMLDDLISDEKLIKAAVFTGDIEVVKIMVEFGFYKGLGPAICMAYINEKEDILRLLLYYQTQVVNILEFSRVRRNRTVTLDTGGMKWQGVQLEHINAEWLYDSHNAVDSVSRALNYRTVYNSPSKNHSLFCQLGKDCLKYFTETVPANSISTTSYTSLVKVTEINLSENQLSSIPPELFQMPSLQILDLSYNQLTELPTADHLPKPIYTAPHLKKLRLEWNQIHVLPEDLFLGLGHCLEDLSVQCNRLEDLPPGIWVVPNLKTLRLSRNHLSRLHYFSSPRYFNDPDFTSKVVGSFTVSGGHLERKDSNADEELSGIEEYIKKLGVFCRTVQAISKVEGVTNGLYPDVYQKILDVHWLRFRHAQSELNRSSSNESNGSIQLEELNLEEDEDCGCYQSSLHYLDLSRNRFREIPWDLPCVAPKLQRLDLRENQIQDLDIIHGMPPDLSTLMLDQNQISNTSKKRPSSLPCGNPLKLLSVLFEDSVPYCSHCCHYFLENLTNLTLDCNQLSTFQVVDLVHSDIVHDLEIPDSSFDSITYRPLFPNLSILSLERNLLTTIPPHLYLLSHLGSLTLSHNPIVELPLEMGRMNTQALLVLKLDGVFIRNVPQNLLKRRVPKYLITYLKSMLEKSRPYRRIKLMVVGEGDKGKTTLLLNLTRKGKVMRFKEVAMGLNSRPLATVGVELGDWEYAPGKKPKVTFMTWDFGGQEEYYATHQCFLTSRSLYLLVWNMMDGEEGLVGLRPWLENIEGRAPASPVIVIGTHLDGIPSSRRTEVIATFRARFRELYLDCNPNTFAYPRIDPSCLFVDCCNTRHMDWLRDCIYDFVMKYKPKGPRHQMAEMDPLLEQPIPESYIKLQDTVRGLAMMCAAKGKVPIYTRKEYINEVRANNYAGTLDELEQATSFLHDNGILLHFEDSLLSDLYFVNPQWLCSMLANVVTVQEKNPFQKNGFMHMEALKQIFHKTSACDDFSLLTEFLTLMQKFEVVLVLDDQRLLIPSLLPTEEQDSCIVFPKPFSSPEESVTTLDCDIKQPYAPIYQLPHTLFARYNFLPFVPNGFFPRLIARIVSTEIIESLRNSLCTSPLQEQHVLNLAHWECWRSGISLIWNHLEIFRIGPLTCPLPGTESIKIESRDEWFDVQTVKGVEIKVAVLPEEYITSCSMVRNPEGMQEIPQKGRCLATWLLQQATDTVNSVFDDWYEAFAHKRGFELTTVRVANPCPECLKVTLAAQVEATTPPTLRRFSFSLSNFLTRNKTDHTLKVFHMFSNTYCTLVLSEGKELECPTHGRMKMADVAPDLVFNDFAPSMLFLDPSAVVTRQTLGDGGFGTVYAGTIIRGGNPESIAVKAFRAQAGFIEQDPREAAEATAWDLYQNANLEARMMYQLDHPHVLALVGLTFRPIRLLLELAPLGDLKSCVKKFRRAKIRLSRKTLKATMIQVAEALDYLHSKKIVFRDLKPGNVLVWKFPLPDTQWNCDSDSTVYVKLADYGISKRVSPQGLRGRHGTPAYSPPEVMLRGDQEAYSTKLDVYSFGMLMYYLFSYLNPFENDPRPITALLEEGKRPELLPKYRPTSLQMFELMCWCWSEKPHHRPDFPEILQVLRTDTFTQLLVATPASKDEKDITAACLRTTMAPVRRRSTTASSFHGKTTTTCMSFVNDISLPYFSTASPLSCSSLTEEMCVEVWYGMEDGSLGVVQYQHSGTLIEQVEQPSRRYVTSVCMACENVWVGMVKAGIKVYDPASKQPIALWGEVEKQQIYLLLHVEESCSVLALARKGMYVFSSAFSQDESACAIVLVPSHSFPSPSGIDINEGVVIPPGANMDSGEIWVCSQSGLGFRILHPKNFRLKEEVHYPESSVSQGRKIRHMVSMVVEGRNILVFADRTWVQKWDVETREQRKEWNCHDACKHIYGDHARSSRITSLLATKDQIYAGTGGGVIVVLNIVSMEVTSLLHGYDMAVRCLLFVSPGQQVRPFMRMFSRKDSSVTSTGARSPKLSATSISSSVSNSGRLSITSLTSNTSFDDASLEDSRSILFSFGKGYRGVVGNSPNHPPVFNLPCETAASTCHASTNVPALRLAKPLHSIGHLLLWSTGSDLQRPTTQDSFTSFNEMEES